MDVWREQETKSTKKVHGSEDERTSVRNRPLVKWESKVEIYTRKSGK